MVIDSQNPNWVWIGAHEVIIATARGLLILAPGPKLVNTREGTHQCSKGSSCRAQKSDAGGRSAGEKKSNIAAMRRRGREAVGLRLAKAGAHRGHWAVLLGVALAMLVSLCGSAGSSAQEWERTIQQYQHTAWTAREGVPAVVYSMAQTTDGYLWIGSFNGLFRFDGVQFEQYRPPASESFPSNEITSLLAGSNGGLWIGFARGGATWLKDGHLTNYGEREGLPQGRLSSFAEDQAGTIWAATAAGLARLERGHWERIGANWSCPGKAAQAAVFDRRGTLWVATENTIVFLPRGAKSFQATGEHIGVVCEMVEAPGGKIWLAETARGVRPVKFPDQHSRTPEIQVGAQALLFDETGSLWISSVGDGIVRVRHPEELKPGVILQTNEAIEKFTDKNGLTDDVVISILRDREGNIWAGTPRSLERLRKTNLVPVSFPPGYQALAISAGDHGSIWTGSNSHPLTHLQNTKLTVQRTNYVGQAYRDSDGIVWAGGAGEVYRIDHDKISHFQLPFGLSDPSGIVTAMTKDQVGRLWVALRNGDLWILDKERWQQYKNAALPTAMVVSAHTDKQGRVWFGYGSDLVAVLEKDSVRRFSREEGIATGDIKAITEENGSLWIGGESGIAFLQGDRFRMLAAAGPDALKGVSGLILAADGSLWASEARGVLQIASFEVQAALRDPTYKVRYRIFGFPEGLPGAIQQVAYPTAVEGTDGRLWFATGAGLVWIDPQNLVRNTLAPNIVVRSIRARGRVYAAEPGVRLPVHTASIEIDYTALSLSVPERVQFRYQLDGVDKDWQDAGTRREASYSNLGPRQYRFRVIACNNDGVWNETGATLDFSVLPAWYQTIWFRSACLVAFVFLLWAMHRIRLRHVERRFNETLEVRIQERTRIAQELHDTLLQSFQALLLRLQGISKVLPKSADAAEAKRRLESALGEAAQAVTEGRDAVQGLRSSTLVTNDLAAALRGLAEGMAADSSTQGAATYCVVVEGTSRELHPILRDDVYRIAGEALRNAFRHAEARRIEVVIHYDERELRVSIRDDGKGIEAEVLEKEGRAGHWGLSGMRERAERIGGTLEIWSRAGTGTEVELKIPAAAAYRTRTGRSKASWLGRLAG
jgi:signal transduction histidine kinase